MSTHPTRPAFTDGTPDDDDRIDPMITTAATYAARMADGTPDGASVIAHPDGPASMPDIIRDDITRARDGYAWDHEHATRRYVGARVVGHDRPDPRTVAAIRRLTAVLGGYRIGDYVAVPNAAVPRRAYGPSVTPDYPARGYTRVRVGAVSDDGRTLIVACDDTGADHDRPHVVAYVAAADAFYVI